MKQLHVRGSVGAVKSWPQSKEGWRKGVVLQQPFTIVLAGLACSVSLLTGLGLLWGTVVAKSLFLGGCVFAVPTIYFTLLAFRYRGASQMVLMVSSFYRGQMGKLVLMAVGFALVFVFVKPLNEAALFVGFCSMIPAHLVVAMFISKRYDDSPKP